MRLAAAVRGGFIYTSMDGGLTWTERTAAGSRTWAAIAGSADGSKLAAAAYRGYIYTSTDNGVSWTERTAAGCREWMSIASSADGIKLAVTVSGGSVFTSRDGGLSWTERICVGSAWSDSGIASSADGTRLAAVGSNSIYTSVDGGITWTRRSANGHHIACSTNGTRLAAAGGAAGGYGCVSTSTDGGTTWTQHDSLYYVPPYGTGSITSSADGSRLVTVITFDTTNLRPGDWKDDYPYVSSDGGAHWTRSDQLIPGDHISLASSADRCTLVAAVGSTASDGLTSHGGPIYASADGGTSWAFCVNAGERNWKGVTSSVDGTRLAAVSGEGAFIFTSPQQVGRLRRKL